MTEETTKTTEVREEPIIDKTVEPLKVKPKKKPKKFITKTEETPKIDLTQLKEDAVQEPSTKEEVLQSTPPVEEEGKTPEVELPTMGSTHNEETSSQIIEEITDEPEVIVDIKEEIKVPHVTTPEIDLPENVEKLVDFMKETGGNVEDFVRLNADYSNIDNDVLLQEYYKKTKPHLDSEEIAFLMEDKFSYDEDYDEEKQVKKKKLAVKEEVQKAKTFLEQLKKDYYAEIKLRPGDNQENNKASEFFNKYNKEQDVAKQQHEVFKQTTKDFFNKDFKGFEFSLGEKRFRYGVNNPQDVAETQSNIANFVKTFLNEKGEIEDYKGYHKAIYAARNADSIAQHFYEQGKADAVKNVVANSKNISTEARTAPTDDSLYLNGLKIKAISGVDSSKLKVKRRKT
tara:strand:- start:1092 stop:2288 length:1197 start_codon:yes stop_codon:yes gene_type:complete